MRFRPEIRSFRLLGLFAGLAALECVPRCRGGSSRLRTREIGARVKSFLSGRCVVPQSTEFPTRFHALSLALREVLFRDFLVWRDEEKVDNCARGSFFVECIRLCSLSVMGLLRFFCHTVTQSSMFPDVYNEY